MTHQSTGTGRRGHAIHDEEWFAAVHRPRQPLYSSLARMISSNQAPAEILADRIARQFASVPQVEAVALAGSRRSGFTDNHSDIDLYVYAAEMIEVPVRAGIALLSQRKEIGNSFWEPGDEWIDLETGITVDVMFRNMRWLEEQLDRVLVCHEASVGYSTCFWYNVRNSQPLFDRSGWYRAVEQKADRPYPEELKHAVIAKNHPILRRNISSYLQQIERALERQDRVSVNHRTSAILASYFDILFAANGQPHPGEKQLVQFADKLCRNLPLGMPQHIEALLAALPDGPVIPRANEMLDGLDDLLRRLGLLPDHE
jgi:hypothetical protein